MKKIKIKIKEKIQDYLKTNRSLKRKIENLYKIIEDNAKSINYILDEKDEYRDKALKLEKDKIEMKQQLRDLTKRDKKLAEIEQLFEGKNVKLRDITKILEGDE